MPIIIDGRRYVVGRAAGSYVNVIVEGKEYHSFKRNKGPETDKNMQQRVQEAVTKLQQEKV